MSEAVRWTQTPPTESGYYWRRNPAIKARQIVYFYAPHPESHLAQVAWWWPVKLTPPRFDRSLIDRSSIKDAAP